MHSTVKAWEHELEALHHRLGELFRRPEPRQRSLAYLKGLLGSVERKNGWQLAEALGQTNPYGIQHLLANSSLAGKMASRAQELICSQYSPRSRAQSLVRLYERLCSRTSEEQPSESWLGSAKDADPVPAVDYFLPNSVRPNESHKS